MTDVMIYAMMLRRIMNGIVIVVGWFEAYLVKVAQEATLDGFEPTLTWRNAQQSQVMVTTMNKCCLDMVGIGCIVSYDI